MCVIHADSVKAESTAEKVTKIKTEAVDPDTASSVKLEPASQQEADSSNTVPGASVKETSVPPTSETFEFLDGVAAFHATAVKKSEERKTLVTNIGPHRRALCARRDLAVRRTLCKVDKVPPPSVIPRELCCPYFLFIYYIFIHNVQ